MKEHEAVEGRLYDRDLVVNTQCLIARRKRRRIESRITSKDECMTGLRQGRRSRGSVPKEILDRSRLHPTRVGNVLFCDSSGKGNT